MKKKTVVRKGVYYDSVKLMLVTNELNTFEGIKEAAVVMGTDLNKETLERTGLMSEEAAEAVPTDMIIAIEGENEQTIEEALLKLDSLLNAKSSSNSGDRYRPKSLETAVKMQPNSSLCIISVPGKYAKDTAMEALKNNLHVMLFSDNVTLEEELELKNYAVKKDLLVMGPDCGTALINNAPLCFSNKVKQGDIGIVAASGTGAQEVMTLISANGGGLTQVIGTGGRDLSEKISGLMVLQGLKALNNDEATKVIVLISKPPAKTVSDKIIKFIHENVNKPVIINFLGEKFENNQDGDIYFESTLEDTSLKALELAGYRQGNAPLLTDAQIISIAREESQKLQKGQKYIRGLFSGGTLAYECLFILEEKFELVESNLSKKHKVKNIQSLTSHTTIDFGEDEFTVGRAHPMIDPTLRHEVFEKTLNNKETAVIVLDIVLGYGANLQPQKTFVETLKQYKGQYVSVIANICGTDEDPQDYETIVNELENAGVIIMPSNQTATKLALRIVEELKQEG
ncbi:acyl-CoA synthetase FdrA [Brevibacillus sp. SYSU BS000544]|uniref:acyl-CoA synthetase FdrA n=1 Tax=Brevibacillus sp. SYSU BS000544 TaxID=3416443 RepID=UPI003CE4553C